MGSLDKPRPLVLAPYHLFSLSPPPVSHSSRRFNPSPLNEYRSNGGSSTEEPNTRVSEKGDQRRPLCVVCRNKFMNCSQLHGSSWPIALTPSSANGNSPSPFSGHLPTPRKHVRGIYEEIKGIYTTISPSSLDISTECNKSDGGLTTS